MFTSIFTVEMGLKVFAEGGAKEYWRKEKNRFDCSVTVVSLVTEVIIFAFPDSFTDHTITRTLQMARIARVLRLLLHFPPYQLLASTYISLLPQLFRLASVVFIIDYEFCLMGVAFYGGQINRLNPKLLGTDYLRSGYMMLNFNDVMSGFITLFALKIVNNWFVIMDAFVAISGQISRVYFVAYWLIAVVTTLSVVVATILDRFLVEVEEREKGVKHSNIDPMLLNGIEGIGELIKVRKRNLVSSH
uniref:Ion transport domain-containing protein n=1 Tax=Arcella intermedia TaxID=1963864 RepID=A0A6B2LD25_9EUKA